MFILKIKFFEVIHADPAVRETNPQTKNCYLQEEKYLK